MEPVIERRGDPELPDTHGYLMEPQWSPPPDAGNTLAGRT